MKAPFARAALAVAALLVVGIAAYALMRRVISTSTEPSPSAHVAQQPCALTDSAFTPLPSGFTSMVDRTMSELPIHRAANSTPPNVGFRGARLVGYLNKVALSQPYLSEAQTRAA